MGIEQGGNGYNPEDENNKDIKQKPEEFEMPLTSDSDRPDLKIIQGGKKSIPDKIKSEKPIKNKDQKESWLDKVKKAGREFVDGFKEKDLNTEEVKIQIENSMTRFERPIIEEIIKNKEFVNGYVEGFCARQEKEIWADPIKEPELYKQEIDDQFYSILASPLARHELIEAWQEAQKQKKEKGMQF